MKKIFLIMTLFALLGLSLTSAFAGYVTFSGSDIVAIASSTVNASGTPMVGDGYIYTTSTGEIRTYGSSGNPTAFNAWLSSLSTGQGLSGFNLWLMDGLSGQAAWWGETLALANPKTAAANIHPFASAGWTGSVYTMGTQWGPNWEGVQIISFKANSAADYLRPGTTATFGFTADVFGFDGDTGPNYQMWVGAGNAGNADVGYNQLAGVDGGIYFQRAITASVPEPSLLIFLGIGLSAACLTGSRFKK